MAYRLTHNVITPANTARAATDFVQLVQQLDATGAAPTWADLSDIKTATEASAVSLALLDDTVGTDGSTETTKGITIGGNDGANFQTAKFTSDGKLECHLDSDIEIGSVELKDGTTDTRAIINAANTARTTATQVLVSQVVDAEGHLADWSDLDDTRIATEASAVSLAIIDDWDGVEDAAAGTEGIIVGGIAQTAQKAAVDSADYSRIVTDLYGQLVNSNFTWATQSNRTEEINPSYLTDVDEALIDTTNLPIDTHYYPSVNGYDMKGTINEICVSGRMNDPDGTFTFTVEGSNDDDLVSGIWIPMTKSAYSMDTNLTNQTSITVTNGSVDVAITYERFPFRYIRFVVVNDGATNAISLHARRL